MIPQEVNLLHWQYKHLVYLISLLKFFHHCLKEIVYFMVYMLFEAQSHSYQYRIDFRDTEYVCIPMLHTALYKVQW